MKINIGDAWKEVADVKINIGDTWKSVFTEVAKAETYGTALTTSLGQRAANTYCGFKITMTETKNLNSVTKPASSEITTAYVLDASKNVIATSGSFSSNVATFASPPTLNSGTSYYVCGAHTSDYASYGVAGQSYPISGTYLNYIGAILNGGDDATRASEIQTMTFDTGTETNIKINIGDSWKEAND